MAMSGPSGLTGQVYRVARAPSWGGTAVGKIKVKDDELDATFKEASGPIDFTVFLNDQGDSKNSTLGWELRVSQALRVGRPLRASSGQGRGALGGTDPKETVLSALKMLDPDGKGSANKDYSRRQLASQADNMTAEEVWPLAPYVIPQGPL
ncbi:Myosin light chain 5 [Bos mutus]|uniref:Myosin light chain 5 n=1 Tax=Bos mutus TaxID=72004 RepID=L8IW44_9CETA|nr:Myosin light chain 5 [Bos mutus]